MDIISAIKSGKPFKQKSARDRDAWLSRHIPMEQRFSVKDILADDWEIQEEKRELSWAEIEKAMNDNFSYVADKNTSVAYPMIAAGRVKKQLGFE